MSQNVLEIENLSISFPNPKGDGQDQYAVHNLSLNVAKGETFALVGESGSGKSLSSLAIMGLLPNNAKRQVSRIQLGDHRLDQYSNAKMQDIRGNRVAMIFQEPMTSLNPLVTIGEQIGEPLRIHRKLSPTLRRQRAEQLLAQVGLEPTSTFYKKYPHELSGGQQQRAMIAMAISCEPDLLIADEPTTALDVTIQKQVLDLMMELQTRHRMSLLFITHDLGVVADIADRIAVMRSGQIVETGASLAIFSQPRAPYTKGLIACRPPLLSKPRRLATIHDFMDSEGRERSVDPKQFAQTYVRRQGASAHQPPPVLRIEGLSKVFEKKSWIPGMKTQRFVALDHINLTIKEGTNFGLVGESGCGKTTLARLLVRLLQPTAGKIFYRDQDIANCSAKELKSIRRRIQYVFQNPYAALNPRFRIEEILMEPMLIHDYGGTPQERNEKIDWLLERVGLDPKMRSRLPHEFSGGQRQRVCIARALTLDPEMIICDESVSALDVSIQAQILNLLLDLKDERSITYLFISHDLSVVKFFSDEVAVMKDGLVVEQAKASDIYHKPQKDFTKQLLEAIPKGIPKGSDRAIEEFYTKGIATNRPPSENPI